MPLDGTVIASIRSELEELMLHSRIDKIYQPETDELVIHFRSPGGNQKLLLSANNQYPRVHLIKQPVENPSHPPVFCMLLRKHLTGGRVVSIEQPHFERILIFHLQGIDELNQQTQKKLVIELMGKHSNMILQESESGKVLDAIKRIPPHISRKRQVLPGLDYSLPPSAKQNPLEVKDPEMFQQVMNRSAQQQIKNSLVDAFNGISPALAMEVTFRAQIEPDQKWEQITGEEKSRISTSFIEIMDQVQNQQFKPKIFLESQGNKYVDFGVIDMTHLWHLEEVLFQSTSEMLSRYYHQKTHQERLHQKSQDLRKNLTVHRNRLTQKLQNLHQDQERAKRSLEDRIKGDIIMANLHNAKQGQSVLEANNIYDEEQSLIEIEMDPRLTPSQNAQAYYRRYRKSKKAQVEIERQRQKTLKELDYLDQMIHLLEQADSLSVIQQIREELVSEGFLKRKAASPQTSASKSHWLQFMSSEQHRILVGKNNLQNEKITFQMAKKNDFWFHVKDLPGSHVVLNLKGDEPTETEIKEAALLAAYYSKGRHGSNVPVDYTRCRFVRKQRHAHPGMVYYEHHQTVFVTPDPTQLPPSLDPST